MIKFSVPTNWQDDLLSCLNKKYVDEIYGSLPYDIVGGGRASAILPFISKKALPHYVAETHKNSLKFNYLLNSTCLDNLEWSSSWQKRFRNFLDYILKAGVDKVTVAIPYLLELIKSHHPQLEVCVSVQARTQTLRQAKFWESLGANEITLFMDINRNFPLLREVKKEINCKLKLIANLTCLYGCPFSHYHGNLQSHASQVSHPSKGFVIDYCTLRCRLIRFSYPEEFIRSRWIRPEDVKIYEDLGFDYLKFVNRNMKTKAICLIVDAYTKREYRANLFDLFPDPAKNLTGYRLDFQKIKYFFRPFRVNIFKLYKAKKLIGMDKIYIDNQKLDGFLQYFLKKDCGLVSCQECSYCKDIAERTISFPARDKDLNQKKYKDFLGSLIDGKLFRYF